MRELPRKQCTDTDEGLAAKQFYMQHVAATIVAGLYLMHAREHWGQCRDSQANKMLIRQRGSAEHVPDSPES